jgi:hypothetical protein
MATKHEVIPNETSGFLSDLAGLPSFLIDPESAAKRVHSKWFWIAPLLVASIVAVAVSAYITPYALHAASVSPLPDGVTAEQYTHGVAIAMKFTTYSSPILTVVIWAIEAVILLGIAVVTGVSARFGAFFNLVAGCAMIQSLAAIATALILRFKGEVSSMAELRPAMGLDIFMPEGTNKYVVAAGASFSVFQIWWLVMMALIFAAAFRVSKAKGFAVVLPLWVFGLLLGLFGAVFQK